MGRRSMYPWRMPTSKQMTRPGLPLVPVQIPLPYKVCDPEDPRIRTCLLIACLVPHAQIMQLLGHAGLRRIFANHRGAVAGALRDDDDEDDLEDGYGGLGTRRRRRARAGKMKYPPVPSEEGRKLMDGGTFGYNENYRDTLRQRKKRLSTRLMARELGLETTGSTRANHLMKQVWKTGVSLPHAPAKLIFKHRGSFLLRTLTRSSTTTLDATLGNSQTTAISSSPARRISKSECTIPPTRTGGSITRPWSIRMANGPLQMPR